MSGNVYYEALRHTYGMPQLTRPFEAAYAGARCPKIVVSSGPRLDDEPA